MTFDQQPQYQPKLGHPSATPGPDPRMIEAIAQALAERQMRAQVGAQDPAAYFQQGRAATPGTGFAGITDLLMPGNSGPGYPYGPEIYPETSDPNALTGGVVAPAAMNPEEAGAVPPPFEVDPADKTGDLTKPAPKAKKKGEYSDFFKALKAAKSGDKDVKKSFKDLAKQLASKEAGNAETTIATS